MRLEPVLTQVTIIDFTVQNQQTQTKEKLTQKTNFSLPSQHNQESPITGSDLIILTFLGVLFISNQIRRLD